MELHKFGFKFFAEGAQGIDLLKLIPMYHRWIQQKALSDLLIDVADYTHVPAGPGVMLIAHEGNYALDETGNRRGVLYYSKLPLGGDFQSRLASVASKALKAARLMAADAELHGELKLPGSELQFIANDRLVAPNTEETYERLLPALRSFLDRLYAGAPYSVTPESDPRERFSLTVRAEAPVGLDTLLERVA